RQRTSHQALDAAAAGPPPWGKSHRPRPSSTNCQVTFAPLCEQANDDRWRFEGHANHRESRPYSRIWSSRSPEVVGEPGDDEALIRNTVTGLNFVDVYYCRGSL